MTAGGWGRGEGSPPGDSRWTLPIQPPSAITGQRGRRTQPPVTRPTSRHSTRVVDLRFLLSPHAHAAVFLDLDVHHVGAAAHRAVLDILLALAGRDVDRHHDLLAARVANVAAFLLHAFLPLGDVRPGASAPRAGVSDILCGALHKIGD